MAKRLKGLDSILRDLEGEPVYLTNRIGMLALDAKGEKQTVMAKSMLSAVLARANSEDPIRAIEIALKIHKANQHVQLDDVDVALLVTSVTADPTLNNLEKAFLLPLLNDAKSVEK